MNKKKYFLGILFFIIIFLYFQREEFFQQKFRVISTPIKSFFLDNKREISLFFKKKEDFIKIKQENIYLKKKNYNQNITINKLKQYTKNINWDYEINKSIVYVNTISYKNFNDFSIILLKNRKELLKNKIFGLIQKNFVAGIALKKGTSLEGRLLSNQNCKFSVSIGKDKANGIAEGFNDKYMKINYISKWSYIKKGDIVTTNGFDNIFSPNIKVGEITKVERKSYYKIAEMKFYADIRNPNYFYLIK